MKEKGSILLLAAFLFLPPVFAEAGTSLTTKLHKGFRESAYPNAAKLAGIEVATTFTELPGNRKGEDLVRAGKVHELLVGEFKKAGWREDDLASDDLTSRKVELVIDEGGLAQARRNPADEGLPQPVFVADAEVSRRRPAGLLR